MIKFKTLWWGDYSELSMLALNPITSVLIKEMKGNLDTNWSDAVTGQSIADSKS